MKLSLAKLVDIGYEVNKELLLSYNGDVKPNVYIETSIQLKESGMFCINLTYKIEVLTIPEDLLNMYKGEYNCTVTHDDLGYEADIVLVSDHVKSGLIYALRRCSGNDSSFVRETVASTALISTTEQILTDLTSLGFYNK